MVSNFDFKNNFTVHSILGCNWFKGIPQICKTVHMWNRETVTSPEGTPHEQLMRFLRQATVPQDQFYEKLVQAQLDVDLQPVQKPRYYHGEYPENAPFVIDDETKEAYREHDEWLKEAMEHQKVINEQRESQWVDPN